MNIIVNVLFTIIKKVVLAFCLIYSFNLLFISMNIIIPLNIITIFVVALLGFSGLLSLTALYFIL